MILLGFDIGSSSVKVSLVEAESGQCVASAFYPKQEAPIISHQTGWAEQDPEMWWKYAQAALREAVSKLPSDKGLSTKEIAAVGISYQMHGLVCVDKDQQVLRPAIIWCDSRAVPYGEEAYRALGEDYCWTHYLNSPGNFTAAKLAWVKQNEPELYVRIDKIMLPGDYIAMRLTGEAVTTVSGLSEGILWDFKERTPAYACIIKERHPMGASLCFVFHRATTDSQPRDDREKKRAFFRPKRSKTTFPNSISAIILAYVRKILYLCTQLRAERKN